MSSREMKAKSSGSNYSFGDKMRIARPPRSLFNLSHKLSTTIAKEGLIIPIALIETVPGDSIDLSISSFLRVMPQVVPVFTNQRVYINAFYSRMGDLWSRWQTFATKGYSGKNILTVPTLSDDNIDPALKGQTIGAEDLASYLGLPIGTEYNDLITSGISALPFMQYETIYKHYYLNVNCNMENPNYFPEDDADFRLGSDGKVISNTDGTKPKVLFGNIKKVQWGNDYFTSSLPFAQRGDTPSINFNVSMDGLKAVFEENIYTAIDDEDSWEINNNSDQGIGVSGTTITWQDSGKKNRIRHKHQVNNEELNDNYIDGSLTVATKLTMDLLRQLAVSQQELEKMARTDGTYFDFGLTFFGRPSKNAMDYKPVYIGGNYTNISFSDVTQTSPGTAPEDPPLGAMAGKGVSFMDNGYIGRLDADDYGYIMVLAYVMPDTYYSQGVSRMWTKLNQEDLYLPERSLLGLREIKNKELRFTSNMQSNEDLFSYQNQYDELRYLENRISGKIADPTEQSFWPYTQSRYFESTPTYSNQFMEAGTIRDDYLAAPNESHYVGIFSFDIRAVRPIPYIGDPGTMIR